jgi:gamma-glutamyltranspeptidase/glutathione hydrolase
VQKDLARTLRLLAQSGPLTFYEGALADLVLKDMERVHGPFTAQDWASYRAVERAPLRGRYRGLQLLCAPPPSSGGVTLLEILAQLEYYDLAATGPRSAYRVHLTSEAMARGFADRNTYLGDPEYVYNPIAGLLSPGYIATLQSSIAMDKASAPGRIRPGAPWKFDPSPRTITVNGTEDSLRPVPNRAVEGNHTTHFSIVDAQGNIVALTTTLNDALGSAYVVPGAGFLLNDEMDDFVAKPGVPNMYGLVGSDTNGIAPGKRPLSSMCPTIVLRGSQPWLVLGSPGGPRIISTVLNILVDRRDHGVSLENAVASPRFHHQWQPDRIDHEPEALTDDVKKALQAMGHVLHPRARYSSAQCIEIEPAGTRRGVSDPRSHGAAMGY